MRQRRETVQHPFGTIKARMGATHDSETGQHRNGPARAGLQSHGRHKHDGAWIANRSDQGLAPAENAVPTPLWAVRNRKTDRHSRERPRAEQTQSSRASSPRTPDSSRPSVLTQPRPDPDIGRRRMAYVYAPRPLPEAPIEGLKCRSDTWDRVCGGVSF
jgi:hypothetical protein